MYIHHENSLYNLDKCCEVTFEAKKLVITLWLTPDMRLATLKCKNKLIYDKLESNILYRTGYTQ